eukprot:jgi/Chlat1/6905/Chrsp52S06587
MHIHRTPSSTAAPGCCQRHACCHLYAAFAVQRSSTSATSSRAATMPAAAAAAGWAYSARRLAGALVVAVPLGLALSIGAGRGSRTGSSMASAAAGSSASNPPLPPKQLELKHPKLYPESIEYDSQRKRLLVSSLRSPAVYEVNPADGTTALWAKLPPAATDVGASATVGLHIDHPRNRLLAVGAAHNFFAPGSFTGVVSFDMSTKEPQWVADLRPTLAGRPPAPHSANDLVAVESSGEVYVTDTLAGLLWRMNADGGDASVWLDEEVIRDNPPGTLGVNGIEYLRTKDGDHLITTSYGSGTAFKIRIADKRVTKVSVTPSDALQRPDGIHFLKDGRLLVTSPLGKVLILKSDDDWDSAYVMESASVEAVREATAAAVDDEGHVFVTNCYLKDLGDEDLENKRASFGITRMDFAPVSSQ